MQNDPGRRSIPARKVLVALLVLAAFSVSGCATVSYYWQAAVGQAELNRNARPIGEVLADENTPPKLAERLRSIQSIREFASTELGLPDNGSYRRYVDLRRPYVVWNVIAAHPYQMKLKDWCFPVVGCVGYRGYFNRDDAVRHIEALKVEGWDVHLGEVPAYSTLGWLDDPVLSTFVWYSEPELAQLIFHELAHQVAYAQGDTTFNESFATAVEQEGLRRWLMARNDAEALNRAKLRQQYREEFVRLVNDLRRRLERMYSGGGDKVQKDAAKQQLITDARAEYAAMKVRWGGFAGYDRWFAQDLNNASVLSVALYQDWVPAFSELLRQQQGDLPAFYREVQRAAKLDQAERRLLLESWAGRRSDAMLTAAQVRQ